MERYAFFWNDHLSYRNLPQSTNQHHDAQFGSVISQLFLLLFDRLSTKILSIFNIGSIELFVGIYSNLNALHRNTS